MMHMVRLILVGAGGTGCQYINNAIRLCRSHATNVRVTIIDGDYVTGVECPIGHPVRFGAHENVPRDCPVCGEILLDKMERQFTRLDIGQKKAKVLADHLQHTFRGMNTGGRTGDQVVVEYVDRFLTERLEVHDQLPRSNSPTLVAAMVDNHESRLLWDEAITQLLDDSAGTYSRPNLSMLSAGNDLTDAEAVLTSYGLDEEGKRVTLARLVPDIRAPGLGLPTNGRRENCGIDTAATQSLIANTAAALAALDLTKRWLIDIAPMRNPAYAQPAYNHVQLRLPYPEWEQASYQRTADKPHLMGL